MAVSPNFEDSLERSCYESLSPGKNRKIERNNINNNIFILDIWNTVVDSPRKEREKALTLQKILRSEKWENVMQQWTPREQLPIKQELT